MRTEQEMFDLILNFAKTDVRVRAVYLNGSRANPNAPKDKYMDFDIVFVVTDFESFTSNNNWIDIFGERLILQMPEAMRYPDGSGHFNWQMLFTDGNRIDLTLIPNVKLELIENDSATVVLLDKDGILPSFPPASDNDYIVKPPDELFYYSCCNNFFWCMQNVAKGIVRDELPYAMGMYNYIISAELNDMVSWYIGTKNSFNVSTGKMGKYFKKYLSTDLYEQYTNVYPNGDYENIWDCVFNACDLFRKLANQVGNCLGYTYNNQDDEGIITYLQKMKSRTL
ncbi:aminoglycoside 6-adenylyltransferase [Sedimentibacter sp. zth1]|uniref:aminoglycoside 6-adenylyltransferase n=1 Tax=Sedimentibacter sp. zth1 TaxID=2816908 RepID=UPI001A92F0B9|nr:aminoglycoside 6-adenylyltransferase [Sedimentibacter sp. zth1]QSX04662.1 aminoglycoside 6-adenylyltransferase [Sedimentibacter sp. zth1]